MHNDLTLTQYQFDTDPFFTNPLIIDFLEIKTDWVSIFDQNGYILTRLEQEYYNHLTEHRGPWEHSFQKPWFQQAEKYEGAVLNHSMLLQRKGFAGPAYTQLEHWAGYMPLLWKVAKIRPKWGLDFSIDWTDDRGNVFEILHWEWDAFDLDSVLDRKYRYEKLFLSLDWDDVAQQMLAKKDQWYDQDFFGQSAWKCDYLGIEHEQFKMVCWK
jgi:hypothetical protein